MSASWLNTPGPPCRFIGPAALCVCVSARVGDARVSVCVAAARWRRHALIITLFILRIFIKDFKLKPALLLSQLFTVFSPAHSSLRYLFLVDLIWIFRGGNFVSFGASQLWWRKLINSSRLRCKLWRSNGLKLAVSSADWRLRLIFTFERLIPKYCCSFTKNKYVEVNAYKYWALINPWGFFFF